MIELFSVLLDIANLKPRFAKQITYGQIDQMKKDHWQPFGPKQNEQQRFIILAKMINHGNYWYRIGIRFERENKETKYPPTYESHYDVKGLVPSFIYKLEQRGRTFDIIDSYKADENDKVTDYIQNGVPREVIEEIMKNLNHLLQEPDY